MTAMRSQRPSRTAPQALRKREVHSKARNQTTSHHTINEASPAYETGNPRLIRTAACAAWAGRTGTIGCVKVRRGLQWFHRKQEFGTELEKTVISNEREPWLPRKKICLFCKSAIILAIILAIIIAIIIARNWSISLIIYSLLLHLNSLFIVYV